MLILDMATHHAMTSKDKSPEATKARNNLEAKLLLVLESETINQ